MFAKPSNSTLDLGVLTMLDLGSDLEPIYLASLIEDTRPRTTRVEVKPRMLLDCLQQAPWQNIDRATLYCHQLRGAEFDDSELTGIVD
jgi:hypothetical protein